MGWVNEKKIFAAEVDDLKKKNNCKKFPDEDEDDYYDEEEDYGEGGLEVGGGSGGHHPPDGGWGWLVLLASFILNLLVDGIGFSFGNTHYHYMEAFNATTAEVALVSSSLTGSHLIVGPIVGSMCFHLGPRKVTILGSVIAMGGFLSSAFVSSLEMMTLTFGIVGGIGLGMMYLPSIVCVSYWFEKKLTIATGIAVCGSGVGQFVMAPLIEHLITEYQWSGNHIILSAIVLNGVVCGAIFRTPDRWHHKRQKQCRQGVEIERGIIMKALIEDKKRQRTISDGSLDNCVITTNNRLIKLEPSLFHCKKSQALRKMLRQLGYSIQSLAVSKTSLQPSNQQVLMEALQQQRQQQQQNGNVSPTNISPQMATGQMQKRNSSPDFNKAVMNGSATADQLASLNGFVSRSNSVKSAASGNGLLVGGVMLGGGLPMGTNSGNACTRSPGKSFTKTRSCDALAAQQAYQQQQPYNMLIKKIMTERVRCNSEGVGGTTHTHLVPPLTNHNGNLPFGSSPALPVGSVDISIQEIPADEAENVVGSCYTSNTSLATEVSSQFAREYVPNSSQHSFVTRISEQDLEHSIKELNRQERRDNSKWWRAWYLFVEMIQLMCRPVFSVFLFSSLFTVFAYYVPYYYIPNLGMDIGMIRLDADFLPSIIGITSTIGRLIVGWLGDRPWINPLYLHNGALLCAGFCCLVLPSLQSPELLCVITATLGFCLAVFVALRSVLLVRYLGVELIPKSFGLLCFFMGIATFIGNPVAGQLADTKSLDYVFYLAGLFNIVSGLVLFPVGVLKRREDRLKANKMAAEEEEEMTEVVDGKGYSMESPVHQCSLA